MSALIFTRPRRPVERVFLHCSASDNAALAGQKLVDEIRRWHTLPKPRGQGWSDIGYQYVIDKRGEVFCGRGLERMPAAQYPHNPRTIAIMVHGLLDFPPEMLAACADLCRQINRAFHGRISFHGHREVNPHKTGPVFNYKALLNLDPWQRMP